jgi:hypothetical protein
MEAKPIILLRRVYNDISHPLPPASESELRSVLSWHIDKAFAHVQSSVFRWQFELNNALKTAALLQHEHDSLKRAMMRSRFESFRDEWSAEKGYQRALSLFPRGERVLPDC